MSIENGIREPCPDQCIGCEHARANGEVTKYYVCFRYLQPESMWRSGVCPSATHMRKQQTQEQKKRAGQQHQQKAKKLSTQQQKTYSRIT